MKNEKNRKMSAGKDKKKRAAAAVAASVIALSLILGVCRGFLNGGKEEGAQSSRPVQTVEKETTGKGRINSLEEEKGKNAAGVGKEGQEKETEKSEKQIKESSEEMSRESKESAGQENAAKKQESEQSPAEASERHEVGDILEDGSMYTGGDVEAGLDYIRENPQIWDQLVWH